MKNHTLIMLKPQKLKKTTSFLYENEIEAMFNAIDKSTSMGVRDYAILELLYGSGLRVSELCSITEKILIFQTV